MPWSDVMLTEPPETSYALVIPTGEIEVTEIKIKNTGGYDIYLSNQVTVAEGFSVGQMYPVSPGEAVSITFPTSDVGADLYVVGPKLPGDIGKFTTIVTSVSAS